MPIPTVKNCKRKEGHLCNLPQPDMSTVITETLKNLHPGFKSLFREPLKGQPKSNRDHQTLQLFLKVSKRSGGWRGGLGRWRREKLLHVLVHLKWSAVWTCPCLLFHYGIVTRGPVCSPNTINKVSAAYLSRSVPCCLTNSCLKLVVWFTVSPLLSTLIQLCRIWLAPLISPHSEPQPIVCLCVGVWMEVCACVQWCESQCRQSLVIGCSLSGSYSVSYYPQHIGLVSYITHSVGTTPQPQLSLIIVCSIAVFAQWQTESIKQKN